MKSLNRSGLAGLAASMLAALILAACGGGGSDKTSGFKSVVMFGDSLSDVGSYAPLPAQFGLTAGKFTTNPGPVWVERVATRLNLTITPHVVGYGATSSKCPAPGTATNCTGHAQGGSRVTDPNGIGHSTGALTIPMKTQIANHLADIGKFTDSDLIFVFGGNNDIFTQFGIIGATASAAAAATGATAASVTAATNAAIVAGTTATQTAADELVGYVKDQILANGGKNVVVFNLPNSANTPFGSTLSSDQKALLTSLVTAFNARLTAGLSGVAVQYYDSNAFAADEGANPAKYGFVNVTAPACSAAKISTATAGNVTDGSSLFCTSATLNTGADVNTFLFADSVHPTTGGHKAIADFVIGKLVEAKWL